MRRHRHARPIRRLVRGVLVIAAYRSLRHTRASSPAGVSVNFKTAFLIVIRERRAGLGLAAGLVFQRVPVGFDGHALAACCRACCQGMPISLSTACSTSMFHFILDSMLDKHVPFHSRQHSRQYVSIFWLDSDYHGAGQTVMASMPRTQITARPAPTSFFLILLVDYDGPQLRRERLHVVGAPRCEHVRHDVVAVVNDRPLSVEAVEISAAVGGSDDRCCNRQTDGPPIAPFPPPHATFRLSSLARTHATQRNATQLNAQARALAPSRSTRRSCRTCF